MRGHDNVGGRGELWLDEKFKESEEMVGWGGIKSLRKEWEGKVLEKRETREKGEGPEAETLPRLLIVAEGPS